MWIEKLPNGKFKYIERYVDPYTLKQKRVSKVLTKDTHQAQTQARKILNEKIDLRLKNKTRSNITLEELLSEWWAHYEESLRETSRRSYRIIVKAIKNEFDDPETLISLADTKLFQSFFDTMNRSFVYKKQFRTVLNLAFKYAVKMQYIEKNPIPNIVLRRPAKTINEAKMIEQRFLEYDEAMLLINFIRKHPRSKRTADVFEFMLLTGLRVGELLALKVKDYHSDDKIIDIHGTLLMDRTVDNQTVGPTKTDNSYREIGLSNRAREILQEVMNENSFKFKQTNESFIFTGERGNPKQLTQLNSAIKKYNEMMGDKKINKRLSTHIFRHSHISLLAELNVPVKAIMQRVGHEDQTTTLKIYTHVTKKQKADIVKKMNSLNL
ncbi:tyrosine-type recombinase/integrase [Enterococcus dongliensis]|uniref:Site-specific integrase n=1 Tax=Enterococcus dongliensis TaxID=2559925 RepID=A0ABU3ESR7_9ENTE|nr:site-specific integrase [Enterococcus dongliensis]MDT2597909.1 site-specific integrase [Enterococcus dongliensis]